MLKWLRHISTAFNSLLLVEVFACSWQAGQLFIENIFFGAHTVTFHILSPVKLTHIKIKDLQTKKKQKNLRSNLIQKQKFNTVKLITQVLLFVFILLNVGLLYSS